MYRFHEDVFFVNQRGHRGFAAPVLEYRLCSYLFTKRETEQCLHSPLLSVSSVLLRGVKFVVIFDSSQK